MIRGRRRGPFSLRRHPDSDVSAMDDATDTKKRPERRLIVNALAGQKVCHNKLSTPRSEIISVTESADVNAFRGFTIVMQQIPLIYLPLLRLRDQTNPGRHRPKALTDERSPYDI